MIVDEAEGLQFASSNGIQLFLDLLSPSQAIATTCQRNISQHATPVWPPCCDLLRHVVKCWVLLAQMWKWSNFSRNICGCCMLWLFGQVRAAMLRLGICLVRFSIPNMSTQHVATGWPNSCSMLRPTMLRSVASNCCDRLARACKMLGQQCWDMLCWNVAIVWPEFYI